MIYAVEVNASRQLYLAGTTTSSESSFPLTLDSHDTTYAGGQDALFVKLTSDLT